MYLAGLEGATKAAKTIVLFLNQRSGKGKATKNSNEQDYRTIFDNLISDVLAVLFWPEWPAATLILGIVVKFMVPFTHSFIQRVLMSSSCLPSKTSTPLLLRVTTTPPRR